LIKFRIDVMPIFGGIARGLNVLGFYAFDICKKRDYCLTILNFIFIVSVEKENDK